MNFFDWIILITLNTSVYTKYVDISDESIEKVLYYKDCRLDKKSKHVPLSATITPRTPRTKLIAKVTPPPMQCSQMCCSFCCPSMYNNQEMNNMPHMKSAIAYNNYQSNVDSEPIQPLYRRKQVMEDNDNRNVKKDNTNSKKDNVNSKKDNLDLKKDNIKKLISRDEDIKKILKDLVKVAMQKLDVVQLVETHTEEAKHAYSFEEEYE